PDLWISNITVPSSAQRGQSYTVTATVRNGGNADAPMADIAFWLKTGNDIGLSADARWVASSDVPPLGVGASTTISFTLTVPADRTLDTGDTSLGTRMLTSLDGGASSTLTTPLTIPATTPAPAGYHVIAMATLDAGTEPNTSNNGAVSNAIAVTPRDQPNLPD